MNLKELTVPKACQCDTCINACKHKPGWFLPGEVEKVAAYLKTPLKDLFNTKLGVDWWVGKEKEIFVIAPAIVTMEEAGDEYPANPNGVCVFFNNNLCKIHDVKPFECKIMSCKNNPNVHKTVAENWTSHQKIIEELLGRPPEAEYSEGFINLI